MTAHHVNFMKLAGFENSVFAKNVSIYQLQCMQRCSFSMAHFDRTLEIRQALFEKETDFTGLVVEGDAVFANIQFHDTVKFQHSLFNSKFSFGDSIFMNGLDLSYSTLNAETQFHNIIMQNTLNLSHIKLAPDEILDLNGIEPLEPGQPILINLTAAPINQIRMNYLDFKLAFDPHASWEDINKVYVNLLHQYQSHGSTPSYRRLYVEYQDLKYHHQKKTIIGLIDRHLWNYGLDKQQALIWLAAAFLLFSIINSIIWPTLAKHYTTINFLADINISEPQKYNPILRFIFFFPYGVVFTVFLFTGGFLSLGARMAKFKGSSILMMSYLLLIRIVGYCALFVLLALIIQ